MSYPLTVTVTLDSINGSSCGSASDTFDYVNASNPPRYEATGSGGFTLGRLTRVTDGGGYTWELFVRVASGAPCAGLHTLRRSPAADDPSGS